MDDVKIKSLGIGSGVLTGDLIDKLKAAEEKQQVKRIDLKIEQNTEKQKDLVAVTTLIQTFKSSVSSLGDETTYLQRKATVNGKSATVDVSSGVDIQNFTLDVKQLAQGDVYQSKKIKDSSNRVVANANGVSVKDGSFVLQLGSGDNAKKFTIDFNTSMTYEDLAAAITSRTDGKIRGKMLNIGGDNPYQLIIQSKDSGESNKITILPTMVESKNSEGNTQKVADENSKNILKILGWGDDKVQKLDDEGMPVKDDSGKDVMISEQEANHIQVAQDAEFKYNGINMSRSSNNFDDITVGIKISLQEKGLSQVNIQNDPKMVKDNIESMVKSYNDLMNKIGLTTNYDSQTHISGTLQGVNEISSLKSTINSILFQTTTDYSPSLNTNDDDLSNRTSLHFVSIQNYGIKLTDGGVLTFEPSKLDDGLNNHIDTLKDFFVGKTTYDNLEYSAPQTVEGGKIQASGDLFTINGQSVKIDTKENASAKDNALAIVDSINQSRIKGIKAVLNSDGTKVNIKATDGADIIIDGNFAILQKLGLSKTNLLSKGSTTSGMFGKLNDVLDSLVGKNGSLTQLDKSWTKDSKDLDDERKRNQQMINDKYERMETQFGQYDKIISKLNSQFSALQSMINAELKSK